MSIENEEINHPGILEQFEHQSTTAKIAEGAAVIIATAAAAYLTHGKSLALGFKLGDKYDKAGLGATEFAEASKGALLNQHTEVKLLSSTRGFDFAEPQLKIGETKGALDFSPARVDGLLHGTASETMTTGLSHDLEPAALPFKSLVSPAESKTLDFSSPHRISLDGAEASNSNLHIAENLERTEATSPRQIGALEQTLGAKPTGFIKLGALTLAGGAVLALAGCKDEKKDCDKDNSKDCDNHSGGGYVAHTYVGSGYTGGGWRSTSPSSGFGPTATGDNSKGYSWPPENETPSTSGAPATAGAWRGSTGLTESAPSSGVGAAEGEEAGTHSGSSAAEGEGGGARGGLSAGEGAHGGGSFGGVGGEGG